MSNSADYSLANPNLKHRDSVFSLLFSEPAVLRELYSAIEGISLPTDIPVSINTLSDVLFRKQINDISFTIDNRLVVLIEHQSSINENMPLRLLEYIGRIYEKIIDRHKVYKTRLVKIPRPEFIVLYNGVEPYPDYREMRLSEAFMDTSDLKATGDGSKSLELKVQVYNINNGHNPELLQKSETLGSYSRFIGKIREYKESGCALDEAMKTAIEYCVEKGILKKFLEKHSSEVVNMLYSEFNLDEAKEVWREEGYEEGMEQGLAEGMEQGLAEGQEKTRQHFLELLNKGLSVEEIKQLL